MKDRILKLKDNGGYKMIIKNYPWFVAYLCYLLEERSKQLMELKDINYNDGIEIGDFHYVPFDYDDESDRPNGFIHFDDVYISWYKHPGRGQEVDTDKNMSNSDWFEWFRKALNVLGEVNDG